MMPAPSVNAWDAVARDLGTRVQANATRRTPHLTTPELDTMIHSSALLVWRGARRETSRDDCSIEGAVLGVGYHRLAALVENIADSSERPMFAAVNVRVKAATSHRATKQKA